MMNSRPLRSRSNARGLETAGIAAHPYRQLLQKISRQLIAA